LLPIAKKNLVITQGFIGKGFSGETTTLGREGSDYSAAIFGSVMGAESITIWKDVAGVMNADPKKFNNAVLIPELTYNDAIELAYYGASVIHPKTIQPLQANGIPLFVKSFINPDDNGTKVSADSSTISVPCKIHKDQQLLLEISTRDFTFIAEDHLKQIFQALSENKVRCNLMQNSAIYFRCVIDNKENRHEPLIHSLENLGLLVQLHTDMELLSIYHPQGSFDRLSDVGSKEIVLQQNMGNSIHYLIRS
jgi:aspartate kinase